MGATNQTNSQTPDALAERLSAAAIAAGDLFAVYLGDRLGYYHALAAGDPLTSSELATRSGTAERYAREWLEHQAVSGILEATDGEEDAASRHYRLPAGHAEALTAPESLAYVAPMVRLMVGIGQTLPLVEEAFRTGGGIPYAAYGDEVREAIAASNRPRFVHLLGSEWLPAMSDVHARLLTDSSARVADLGCGSGWSSIAIAQAYPLVCVDGFDLDEASIAAARQHAIASGVADRVSFQVRDAGDPTLGGSYALAFAFECIHDMADPVAALRAMRQLVGDGGAVLVVDERAAETFTAPGDDMERLLYTFSILHCLPVGMADRPSAATGAVMRPATLRHYAAQAGFDAVEVLPIESDLWRFYRLNG